MVLPSGQINIGQVRTELSEFYPPTGQISLNDARVRTLANRGTPGSSAISLNDLRGKARFLATGGTISNNGCCTIHKFTGTGTFCVTQLGTPPTGCKDISFYMIGGGGGTGSNPGGSGAGGGGGGGGCKLAGITLTPSISMSATILIGAGGAPGPSTPQCGCNGGFSYVVFPPSFASQCAFGGGGAHGGALAGNPGGSGGGAGAGGGGATAGGGTGTQLGGGGCPGGASFATADPQALGYVAGGGGGGAQSPGAVGGAGGGAGGSGVPICGTTYASGGLGGFYCRPTSSRGPTVSGNKSANTGNGANAGCYLTGYNGGSGIVLVVYSTY